MTTFPAVPDTIALAKPEDVGLSRERLARLGERLDAEVAAGLLPGAVALVARHGRIAHFKAYGRRSPDGPDPMERDTIFRIYSMTKPVVSVAAMMLAEEGRLDLAAPLSRFVPGFADARVLGDDGVAVPAARAITVHDLLRHTSGLTYDWLDAGPAGALYVEHRAGRRTRSNAEQAAFLATLPLAAHPGSRFVYGRSVDVLGHVIEQVAGEPLGDHLAARIFGPLGMMETAFRVPADYAHRLAGAFARDPDTGEEVTLLDVLADVPQQNGGGGLASTAVDYARFLHMLAAGGTLEGTRLLSPATVAFMLSDHLAPGVENRGEILPEGYGFGLGFAVRRADGIASCPGSTGDAWWEGLAGTSFWLDPAQGLYALLMIQAPGRREHYRRLFRSIVYAAMMN